MKMSGPPAATGPHTYRGTFGRTRVEKAGISVRTRLVPSALEGSPDPTQRLASWCSSPHGCAFPAQRSSQGASPLRTTTCISSRGKPPALAGLLQKDPPKTASERSHASSQLGPARQKPPGAAWGKSRCCWSREEAQETSRTDSHVPSPTPPRGANATPACR